MRIDRILAVWLTVLLFAPWALAAENWQGTWASAQMLANPFEPPYPPKNDFTLRQNIRISSGGNKLRVRFSNEFGDGPLEIGEASIALSGQNSAIKKGREKPILFGGQKGVVIAAGETATSDPLILPSPALSRLTITLYIKSTPKQITAHPGSRTTSYIVAGNHIAATELTNATRIDRWYFLSAVEVSSPQNLSAVAVLGDSITDGRGSTTNGNDRWPDHLAERLAANPKTAGVGVLNLGIGGNRLLRDGLGPRAISRLQRDIFNQANVRWLIVLEGVNDLGTRPKEKGAADPGASVSDILAAYQQIIREAHAHGIRVYGATILPFADSCCGTPQNLADQEKINEWIRTSGAFDAVIDLERVVADPPRPEHLLPVYDTGDHLHPSAAGYKPMGDAVSLSLFTRSR